MQNTVKRYIQLHSAEQPYYKHFYDSMANKKEYMQYREMLLSNDKYISFLDSAIESIGCDAMELINIQCITLSYIGFAVESIAINTLSSYIPTKANYYLDNVKKADLLINNSIYVQIKNTSFLESAYYNSLLRSYEKANNSLHFLFWDIDSKGNVAFRKVNGKLFIPIQYLGEFDILDTDIVTPQTFYDEISKLTMKGVA